MPEVRVARPLEQINSEAKIIVFLAGITGNPDWRSPLISSVAQRSLTWSQVDLPVVIIDPRRPDWDALSPEDTLKQQIEWELTTQDSADVVAVFFHDSTLAPISMLELGLCIRSGRALVCATAGYAHKDNVKLACRQYGATYVQSSEDLVDALEARILSLQKQKSRR
jgi:hypothetical protein